MNQLFPFFEPRKANKQMKFAEKLSSDLFQKRNAQPDSLSIESSECLQKPQQFVCGNLNGGEWRWSEGKQFCRRDLSRLQGSTEEDLLPQTIKICVSKCENCPYIQKGGSRGSRNPQTILNFPQKDCLRTRKVSRLHCLQSYWLPFPLFMFSHCLTCQ